jgi:hypothetical protein
MQINNLRWNADNNYKKKYRGGSVAGDDINRF